MTRYSTNPQTTPRTHSAIPGDASYALAWTADVTTDAAGSCDAASEAVATTPLAGPLSLWLSATNPSSMSAPRAMMVMNRVIVPCSFSRAERGERASSDIGSQCT